MVNRKNDLFFAILLGCVLLLVGCAGTQTNPWTAFSPQEQSAWQAAGVSPEFAGKMKAGGITPDKAVTWLNADFKNADDIVGWNNAGFAPDEAKIWAKNSVSFQKARPWKESGFNYSEAMDWQKTTKLPADIAGQWRNKGFTTPNVALSWMNSGFEPFVAEQWAKNNFQPADAAKWRAKQFNAGEAGAWNRQGISLTDAIRDRAKGLVPKGMN